MQNIDKHNAEEWFFDYFEGNLSHDEQLAVQAFVAANPEFHADFKAWESSFVQVEEQDYPLAAELLASERGAIWMKWAMGFFLLAGTALSLSMITNGISSKDKFISDHGAHAPMLVVRNQKNGSTTIGSHSSPASSATTSSNSQQSSMRNAFTNSSARSTAEASTSHHTADAASAIFNTNEAETVEWTGVIPQHPYGGRGSMRNPANLALEDAIGKFQPEQKNNMKRQSGDLDDRFENRVYHGDQKSALQKLHDKLSKAFQQPLGLTNLHDPQFGIDLYPNMLAANPAFAGNLEHSRAQFGVRSLRTALEPTNMQGHFAVDGFIPKIKTGIGFTAEYSGIMNGTIQQVRTSIIVSPKIQLRRDMTLAPAIAYSLGTVHTGWNRISNPMSFETDRNVVVPVNPHMLDTTKHMTWQHDISGGVLFNSKRFHAGASFRNIGRPALTHMRTELITQNESTRLPVEFTVHVGTDYRFHANHQVVLSPYALMVHRGGRTETFAGSFVRLHKFVAGANLSTALNTNLQIGFEARNTRLLYTFDHSDSQLFAKKYSSHALTLRIIMGVKRGPQAILQH